MTLARSIVNWRPAYTKKEDSDESARGQKLGASLSFFRAAIASGLVTVILRTSSAPLPKRVVLNAFARRMRL